MTTGGLGHRARRPLALTAAAAALGALLVPGCQLIPPDQKGPATRHAWAPLTRRCRRDLPVEGIDAGVSVRNDMPPDRLALRRYDEFGVTWPVPEQTVWRVLVQQVA